MVKYLEIRYYNSIFMLPLTKVQGRYVENQMDRGNPLPNVAKLKEDKSVREFTYISDYILNNNEFKDRELVGVEIGVWTGRGAHNLLKYLNMKKLYLVDPYKLYEGYDGSDYGRFTPVKAEDEAKDRLKEYKDKIKFIKKYSEDAADKIPNDLDFVYIDGNHSYEYCKKDLDIYWKKLKTGGVIGGDDLGLHCPGVCHAVGEFIVENNLHMITRRCRSMFEDWIIVK